jgi:hypothetical protein
MCGAPSGNATRKLVMFLVLLPYLRRLSSIQSWKLTLRKPCMDGLLLVLRRRRKYRLHRNLLHLTTCIHVYPWMFKSFCDILLTLWISSILRLQRQVSGFATTCYVVLEHLWQHSKTIAHMSQRRLGLLHRFRGPSPYDKVLIVYLSLCDLALRPRQGTC